jgi:hypothetical protein
VAEARELAELAGSLFGDADGKDVVRALLLLDYAAENWGGVQTYFSVDCAHRPISLSIPAALDVYLEGVSILEACRPKIPSTF